MPDRHTSEPTVPTIRDVVDSNELTPVDGVGVVAFTAVATLTHGAAGALAGCIVLVIAALTAGPTAFVAAQLLLVTVFSQWSPATFAAAQGAVFPLLAGSIRSRLISRRLVGLTVAYVGTLGVVWALVTNLRWLWQAGVLFVVAAAVSSYAIHRYERVSLGLVNAEGNR
ncbi:hypothetical protein ACFQJC_03830 [Haloferax namakaokahaiae]|uniref:DUF8163 domain-containing protein n=1 Tax=Haloferax namakaokahaiae TaxID=1748331 RepID=A0ABD5ZC40_9EURY